MKNHSISHWVLRVALGSLLLAGNVSAHPGHPGHDHAPSAAASLPDTGHILIAAAVAALALFVNRDIFRRLP